jgi:hypothetical protein
LDTNKSEETVINNCIDNALVIIKLIVYEILQSDNIDKINSVDEESGFKLFKFYEKSIDKAYKKVRLIFILINIVKAYFNL